MGTTRLMNGPAGSWGRTRRRSAVPLWAGSLTVAAGGALILGALAMPAAAAAPGASGASRAASGASGASRTASGASLAGTSWCTLGANGSSIKHVIYIQFDNVHYTRDQANVPSDLEQMPN